MVQVKSLRTGIKYKETPIGKIPVDWEVVRLADVANQFLNGGTPDTKKKEYWDGKLPWITGADFINKKVGQVRKYITDEGVKNSATNVIPKGALLVVTRTGVGKLAIAPFDVAISQDVTGVITDTQKTIPGFLYWYFNYNEKKLKSAIQGTSINGILRDDLASFLVGLPPLKEQRNIAGILTTVDNAIEETDKIIEKTKELKKGLMQKLLTHGIGHKKFKKTEIGNIPKEWKIETLSNIASKITDGTHVTPTYVDDGVPFLRVTDIQTNKIEWSKVKRIPSEEHAGLIKRCKPEKGDILLSKNGTIGLVKIVDWDEEFSIFVSLCLIKINRTDIDKNYLAKVLGSDVCLSQAKLRSKQGTVTNLHLEEIREFAIPIPSVNEQREINDILSLADREINNEAKHKQYLESIKKSLMQVLLTGKVRVQLRL